VIPRAFLLLLALALATPAQDSRPSECAQVLARIADTLSDSAKVGPAMLVEFALRTDEAAYTLAARVWQESLELADPSDRDAETLESLRDDASVPGPKRALAARMRRMLLARRNPALLAEEAARGHDGQVRAFGVVGPFGFQAESVAGFVFPPEREMVRPGVEYPGFDGPVTLSRYTTTLASDQSDPFERLTPKEGATYSIARLVLKEPRTLLVMLESQGSAELFVDGKKALALDRRREIVPDGRWVAAEFPPGVHRIMVKTTDSGEGAFRLTLANPDRSPCELPSAPSGPTWVDDFMVSLKEEPVSPAKGTGPDGAFVVQDFRDVATAPADRAGRIVAAFLASIRGLQESAFVDLEPLLDEKDLSLGELWLAWRVVDATNHLPDNDKLARGLDLARRAVGKDAAFAPMAAELARNEAKNDRIEEGLAMVKKALAAHPRSVDLHSAGLELLTTAGFESDRHRAIAAAVEACPGSTKILDARLAHLQSRRAWESWTSAARGRLKLDAADLGLVQALGGRLLAARALDDLGALLKDARVLFKNDARLMNLEVSMAREAGDADAEQAALFGVAVARPKDPAPYVTMAERALEKGAKGNAAVALREALARDPDLHDARRLLSELDPPKHDYFAEFAVDTTQFLAKAPGADEYPDSRIVMLLDQIVLWIRPDGTAAQETHQLHRLQDPRGKEDLGTVHGEGDVKVVRTILPDGTSLVPNPGGHGGYEMAGLAPGVVVERKFRRYVDRARGRPEGFGGFYFQDTRLVMPFHYSRYVVIVPKSLGLVPVVKRFEGQRKEEERGDDVVYTFLVERVPRIQQEVMMPRAEDVVPHVEFRRPDAWNKINRRYLDAYEMACRATPTLRAAAVKAVGDEKDPLAKAKKLYDFVLDTVISNEGTGWPTQTLLEKSGDRFALYLALLQAAGVPHRLAMGRTQEKMSPPVDWQMIEEELFEYPLARIEPPGGEPVYVGTQFRYLPFGLIRHDLTDAPVFVTGDDGGRIERIPPVPLSEAKTAEISMDVALDAEGAAKGTVSVTVYGWRGALFKEQIERAEKKRLDQFATGFVLGPIGRLAPKQQGAARFKNATSRTEPLVIEIDVEMKQLVRKSGTGGTMEIPFRPLTLARAFVDRKERKLPFVFHQYMIEDDQATISLDPVWKVDSLPEDFERSGPLGTIAIRRTAEGTKLSIKRAIALTPADVPASGFPDVASFAKDVDQAEAQKITLRRETQ
jgi:hypothetical protein